MAKKFLSCFLASSILFGVSCAASISAGAASQVTRQAEVRSPSKVKGLFWKASRDQHEIFLLGSIHVGDESLYPLPEEVLAAFNACEVIGVEVDVNNPANMKKMKWLMVSNATYPGVDHIGRHLQADSFSDLNKFYQRQGQDPADFKKYLPWYHLIMVSHSYSKALGLSEAWGVDKYFLGKVGVRQKLEELERFEDQAFLITNVMNSKGLLEYELKNQTSSREKISRMLEAWKSGDSVAMEKIIFEKERESDPDYRYFMDELHGKRNLVLATKIEDYVNRKTKAFVILGAAHFLGDKGILKLLAERGVRATTLKEEIKR